MTPEEKLLELVEEYNQLGICIKRSINGVNLPSDTKPSVVILKNITSITQKFYLTQEEAKEKYGYNQK